MRLALLILLLVVRGAMADDGRGRTIVILESELNPTHLRQVTDIVRTGPASAADISVVVMPTPSREDRSLTSNPDSFDRLAAAFLNCVTEGLKACGTPDAINVSQGLSRVALYNLGERVFEADRATIVTLVDEALDRPGSRFNEARQKYADTLAELDRAGTVVVVAAGNDEDDRRPEDPERATLNLLALEPALVVGACLDDGPAPFSARGAALLAPGAGTSYAAPQVASAVALVKERWPALTPGEVVSRLKAGARDGILRL